MAESRLEKTHQREPLAQYSTPVQGVSDSEEGSQATSQPQSLDQHSRDKIFFGTEKNRYVPQGANNPQHPLDYQNQINTDIPQSIMGIEGALSEGSGSGSEQQKFTDTVHSSPLSNNNAPLKASARTDVTCEFKDLSDLSDQDVHILVLGLTGSGKSTFVNLLSGSNHQTSGELASCTKEVEPGLAFIRKGRRVILLDTPGFNDDNEGDAGPLNRIIHFLERYPVNFHSVFYLLPIDAKKLDHSSIKAFKLFLSICGRYALKNAVIVTNMWPGSSNPAAQEMCESREKKYKDHYLFKPVLSHGVKLCRHLNNEETAGEILDIVLEKYPTLLPVQEAFRLRMDFDEPSPYVKQELDSILSGEGDPWPFRAAKRSGQSSTTLHLGVEGQKNEGGTQHPTKEFDDTPVGASGQRKTRNLLNGLIHRKTKGSSIGGTESGNHRSDSAGPRGATNRFGLNSREGSQAVFPT
ncbi:P-loop containing nucleoside triphosphate hydrolase protein [Collybia nuda]|uniref:P-loop containing nucleoside triphosphate hydrolase protein n=1 Tax=Collybia nuda TaxID=64659 RepID=A0A9P6CFB4_9AGAR|nr:P-loop containing nucleoside triphosphate hydrolase protein [Collybia nuda]